MSCIKHRGGYSKPSVCDILWIQLVLLPYNIALYIQWYARWIWKFTICRQEYGEEEKRYLIRRNLKISQNQFDVSYAFSHLYSEFF